MQRSLQKLAIALLFVVSLSYFVVRGPYREIRALNSYDFASVYGATRCWVQGDNPYDMQRVQRAIAAAGNRPPLPHPYPPPSIYLPTTLPVVATLAWLSWIPARLLWCLLSLVVFASSLLLVFRNAKLPGSGKWLLAAAVLFFSPTTSGLSTGNPSVIGCGLTMLAVYLVITERPLAGTVALGIAHCLKPQISIAAAALFALWSYWRPLSMSVVIPVISGVVGLLRAGSVDTIRQWLASLREGTAGTFAVGALSDPRPSNLFSYRMLNVETLFGIFVPDLKIDNLLAWTLALLLVGLYLWLRQRGRDRFSLTEQRWIDMAFFSAVTLTVVYHRYYDAQLLLMAFPFVVNSIWGLRPHDRSWAVVGILCCLILLEFPTQAFAEGWAAAYPVDHSLLGFLLFRHQSVGIVAICVLVCCSIWRGGAKNRA